MRAALWKREALRDLTERHGVCAIGEKLDDGEATFGGYVRHGRVRVDDQLGGETGSTPAALEAEAKNAVIASIWPPCISRPSTQWQPNRIACRMMAVGVGVITTSPTSVEGSSGPTSAGRPSSGRMPTGEAFTIMSTLWGTRFDAVDAHSGKARLSLSTRTLALVASVSMMSIDFTRASASAQAIALPAPPAPKS